MSARYFTDDKGSFWRFPRHGKPQFCFYDSAWGPSMFESAEEFTACLNHVREITEAEAEADARSRAEARSKA